MRLARAAFVVICVLASACTETPVFRNAAACLRPSQDSGAVSLPALVDRADIVVLASVVRSDPVTAGAQMLGEDGRRVTLKVTDTSKGGVAPEFVVYDAPCPVIAAKAGESLVLFLESTANADGSLRPIGLPISALRATPERPLAQLMVELRAVRPLDGDARALFERYGWNVTGKHVVDEFELPTSAEFALAGREIRAMGARFVEPFQNYAALSAGVGLDPRPFAGKPAELLTFFLEQKRGEWVPGMTLGHALIAQRQLVGAWVSLWPEHGAFSVRDRVTVLATPVGTPGRWSPPLNRIPQGVNLARAYNVANARMIAFKTGAGGSGEIRDPARMRAFAAALDETLPTVQATFDRETQPTTYYFHIDFPTRYLSLQYDTRDGMLTVLLDGFSAKAPARFASLVADLR